MEIWDPRKKPRNLSPQAFIFIKASRNSLDDYIYYVEAAEICVAQAFIFWDGSEKQKKTMCPNWNWQPACAVEMFDFVFFWPRLQKRSMRPSGAQGAFPGRSAMHQA